MTLKEIREELGKGGTDRIENAIKELLKFTEDNEQYDDLQDALLHLGNQIRNTQLDYYKNIITQSYYDLRSSQVLDRTLQIINDIKDREEYNIGRLSPDPIHRRNSKTETDDFFQTLDFADWLELKGVHQHFFGREWVVKEVKNWLRNEHGSRFFVLKGSFGAGKTAVLHDLLQKLPEVIAHHYCISGFDDSLEPDKMTLSLAAQMAEKYRSLAIPSTRNHIVKVIKNGIEYNLALSKLMAEPLKKEEDSHFPRLIVIDGLNEGFDPDHERDIVSLLHIMGRTFPDWVRFLVSYYYTPEIDEQLAEFDPKVLDLSTDIRSEEDIRDFIKSTFILENIQFESKNQTLIEINNISNLCKNNFLFAKLFMSNAIQSAFKSFATADYPRKLPGIFSAHFKSIFELSVYREKVKPILEVIVATKRPLTGESVAKFLGIDASAVHVYMQALSAYVPLSKHGFYLLFHQSIGAWLRGEIGSDKKYTIDVHKGHQKIASYLMGQLDEKTDEREPLLQDLIFHLIKSNQYDDIVQVLSDSSFIHGNLEAFGINNIQDDYFSILETLPFSKLQEIGQALFATFDRIEQQAKLAHETGKYQQLQKYIRKDYYSILIASFFFVFLSALAKLNITDRGSNEKVTKLADWLLSAYQSRISNSFALLESFVKHFQHIEITIERLDQLMSYTTFFFSAFYNKKKDILFHRAIEVAYESFTYQNLLKIKCLELNKRIIDVAFQYNFLAHFTQEIGKDGKDYYKQSGAYYLQSADLTIEDTPLFKDKVIHARQVRNAGWNYLVCNDLPKCLESFSKAKEKLELIGQNHDYIRLRKAELDLRCYQLIIKFIEEHPAQMNEASIRLALPFLQSFWENYFVDRKYSSYPAYLLERIAHLKDTLGEEHLAFIRELAKPIEHPIRLLESQYRIMIVSNEWDFWLADLVYERLTRWEPKAFLKIVDPANYEKEERSFHPDLTILFGGSKAPFTGHLVSKIFYKEKDFIFLQERLEDGFGGIWQKLYKSRWFTLIAGNDEETIDGTLLFLRRQKLWEGHYSSTLTEQAYFKHLI